MEHGYSPNHKGHTKEEQECSSALNHKALTFCCFKEKVLHSLRDFTHLLVNIQKLFILRVLYAGNENRVEQVIKEIVGWGLYLKSLGNC